jgi:hypothetical protein
MATKLQSYLAVRLWCAFAYEDTFRCLPQMKLLWYTGPSCFVSTFSDRYVATLSSIHTTEKKEGWLLYAKILSNVCFSLARFL